MDMFRSPAGRQTPPIVTIGRDYDRWPRFHKTNPLSDSISVRFMATHLERVIEGCCGNLIEAAVARCSTRRFLNPGADVCVSNARNRPYEPGYCESPEHADRGVCVSGTA